ncbi:hypothetical protein PF004_g8990 [Phytophthora fragariae]|uniref:Uncharacterized protein n=1 Tax=Phytophthora fragariae TaxID=53985 RepID=A0A6G0P523_9STRA|nr:hypothetical protein PF004_g8990 [Phytophthora fragariae]
MRPEKMARVRRLRMRCEIKAGQDGRHDGEARRVQPLGRGLSRCRTEVASRGTKGRAERVAPSQGACASPTRSHLV